MIRQIFAIAIIFSNLCYGSTECLKLVQSYYKTDPEFEYYSQYFQDIYVFQKYFKDKRGGVFVDIGAHDGVTFSNTYLLEKKMGWRGICVEPIPEVFAALEKRRAAICVQGCIGSGEKVQFLRVRGSSEMLSGILNKYDERHLNRVHQELRENGGTAELIEVPCYDLTNLLVSNGFLSVDYMSIDTEGGELDILKSIDFDRIAIHVIDVENNHREDALRKFLETKGYLFTARLGVDEIYVR